MTKKTTTICCAVALLATTAATPALSQAKNFAGPNIAINLQTVGSAVNINLAEGGNVGDVGKTDNIYGIDLSYSFPIDNKFLITLGGTYDLNKQDAGSWLGIIDLKIKDHYSVYLAPTFTVSDNTALFLKGGYHEMKGEASIADVSGSTKFNGWGYGAGIKTMLDKNLFVQAELQYVDYGSETDEGDTFDVKTTAGVISIGYKF